jgi:hypothetical protein
VKFALEEARKAYKNAIYVQETINNQKVVKATPAKKKVILDAIVPRRNNRCHY